GWQGGTLQGIEVATLAILRIEIRVVELEGRQLMRFLACIIETDDVDRAEQREGGQGVLPICEIVAARGPHAVCMCFDEYRPAATARANFKAGTIVRERIYSIFILKRHGDQELWIHSIAIIAIANLREQRLLPLVPVRFAGVDIVEVLDSVAERVQGQG